jgi:poly(A) polymerase
MNLGQLPEGANRRLEGLLGEPAVARLLSVLNGDGEETRIVGGAVRNTLLGEPVTDVDCATTAPPKVTAARARRAGFKVVPTGLEHGTVTVIIDGQPFEVTTLREDVETDGRRAVVRFGRDFTADARRRDFTINALGLSADGRLHDDVGGLADLAARRLRFIGDPASRIAEDYLRILRFFRFHARYGVGALDPDGLHAAIVARDGLSRLSRERVRVEILKLLVAPRAGAVLSDMAQAGFLTLFLGGVPHLAAFERLASIEQQAGLPPDPVARLAVLAVRVEEDATRLRERLRLSNNEGQALLRAAQACECVGGGWPWGNRALADLCGATAALVARCARGEGFGDLVPLLTGTESLPAFPWRGSDLIAAGLPRGPAISGTLARLQDAWRQAGLPVEAQALDSIFSEVLAQARSREQP